MPLPTIDPQVVRRSRPPARSTARDFRYRHFAAVKRLPTILVAGVGMAGLVGLVKLPPTRRWLLGRLASGQGPTAEQRAKSWFTVRFLGSGGGRKVLTEVAGGDPGTTRPRRCSPSRRSAWPRRPAADVGQVTR